MAERLAPGRVAYKGDPPPPRVKMIIPSWTYNYIGI
jgi:hypothetical protein